MVKSIITLAVLLVTTSAMADQECMATAKASAQASLVCRTPGHAAECEKQTAILVQPCIDEEARKAKAAADAAAKAEAERLAAEKEAACRASAVCMTARAKDDACGLVQAHTDLTQQISREKSNPAGVVNLSTLHTLGQMLQTVDASIPAAKAKYTALAHKPLVCQ